MASRISSCEAGSGGASDGAADCAPATTGAKKASSRVDRSVTKRGKTRHGASDIGCALLANTSLVSGYKIEALGTVARSRDLPRQSNLQANGAHELDGVALPHDTRAHNVIEANPTVLDLIFEVDIGGAVAERMGDFS